MLLRGDRKESRNRLPRVTDPRTRLSDIARRRNPPALRARAASWPFQPPPAAAIASRATSASSNGSTVPPTIWPVSCLAGNDEDVARRSEAIAAAIASLRSPISIACGAATRIARRIPAAARCADCRR